MNGDEVGKISKQWSGLAREMFTDADFFGISFPMDLDVRMKAVMLGACFLIVRHDSFDFPSPQSDTNFNQSISFSRTPCSSKNLETKRTIVRECSNSRAQATKSLGFATASTSNSLHIHAFRWIILILLLLSFIVAYFCLFAKVENDALHSSVILVRHITILRSKSIIRSMTKNDITSFHSIVVQYFFTTAHSTL